MENRRSTHTPMSIQSPLHTPGSPVFDPGSRHVLDSMPGVAYVETEGPTGMTSYVSPRIEALTGHPPERFVESRAFWYSLIHPEDRARIEAADLVADATSSPYLEEYRLIATDGRIVWVRDESVFVPTTDQRPGHWIGLIVDISEQKRLETELRSEAVKFKSLAERIPAVVYIEGGAAPTTPRITSVRSTWSCSATRRRSARPTRPCGGSSCTPRIASASSRPPDARTSSAGSTRTTGWSPATVAPSGSTTRPS